MTIRTLIIAGFMVAGIFMCRFLNFSVLENIIIPNPCYYHGNEDQVSWLFSLFYHFPSFEGYHPFPTMFNFVFTLITGVFFGWKAGVLFSRAIPIDIRS